MRQGAGAPTLCLGTAGGPAASAAHPRGLRLCLLAALQCFQPHRAGCHGQEEAWAGRAGGLPEGRGELLSPRAVQASCLQPGAGEQSMGPCPRRE